MFNECLYNFDMAEHLAQFSCMKNFTILLGSDLIDLEGSFWSHLKNSQNSALPRVLKPDKTLLLVF